ncbi:hypothetical protein [Aneurinibacillus terranovensis]|uniref:hypothetical protein n=1 Tax=Aneurinibacillus terranovensis TaxID=278991 RepID=UPI001B7FD77D
MNEVLKETFARCGDRGGGNPLLAQGATDIEIPAENVMKQAIEILEGRLQQES